MVKFSTILLSTLVISCGAKVKTIVDDQTGKDSNQSADASQTIKSNIDKDIPNDNTCTNPAVNLYSGASTDFRLIETISLPETKYSILNSNNGWTKINVTSLNIIAYADTDDLCQNLDTATYPSELPIQPLPSAKPTAPANQSDISVKNMINLAEKFVGFSYWWGGARFELDSSDKGSCKKINGQNDYKGHGGANGADCSGFVSKIWLLPAVMPLEKQTHPYSTDDFYNKTTKWNPVKRKDIQKADAMVYRSSASGHIVIYDSGDNWNQIMTYEAKGCAYGVIHQLRAITTAYKAIRRNNIIQ